MFGVVDVVKVFDVQEYVSQEYQENMYRCLLLQSVVCSIKCLFLTSLDSSFNVVSCMKCMPQEATTLAMIKYDNPQ